MMIQEDIAIVIAMTLAIFVFVCVVVLSSKGRCR